MIFYYLLHIEEIVDCGKIFPKIVTMEPFLKVMKLLKSCDQLHFLARKMQKA